MEMTRNINIFEFTHDPTQPVMDPGSYVLAVYGESNELIARINARTGEIEFGAGAPVEERAREFWRILARYAPRKEE